MMVGKNKSAQHKFWTRTLEIRMEYLYKDHQKVGKVKRLKVKEKKSAAVSGTELSSANEFK